MTNTAPVPDTWVPVGDARHTFVQQYTPFQGGRTFTITRTLDQIMGLDCPPIRVSADGTLVELRGLSVPELYAECDDEGSYTPGAQDDAARSLTQQGWEPVRGASGQHGSGHEDWFMHASEFIGGSLAVGILDQPGIYAAVVVWPAGGDDPENWAVLRKTSSLLTPGDEIEGWACGQCGRPVDSRGCPDRTCTYWTS